MLKKAGFGLLLLVLVSSAIAQFPEKFERPWDIEYKWPGNSSVVDYTLAPLIFPKWNIYVTQGSLEYLAVTAVETPYAQNKKITWAQANYSESRNIYAQVDEFADYGVLPFAYNIGDVCAQLGIQNCSCVVMGNALDCNANVNREVRYLLATRWLSPYYAKAWKGTMDNSIDALEERAAALNQELLALESGYETVNYTGACARDVAGYEACEAVLLFFGALEDNGTAPEYANFTRIRLDLTNNTLRVHDDVPYLGFGGVVNSIGDGGGGAMGKVRALKGGLESQYNETLSRYEMISDDAQDALNRAGDANRSANAQELWRIRAGPSFGDMVGDDVASVSEKAGIGAEHLSGAYANKNDAGRAIANGERGYLRSAIVNMTNAKTLAGESERDLGAAMADAHDVVSGYEANAHEWISKVEAKFGNGVWPQKAAALYNASKESSANGQREQRLGRQFEYYVGAIGYAKGAYAVSPETERDTNWTAIAACAEAGEVIGRAESDGIDVTLERAMLSVLGRSGNTGELIQGCARIVESVTESAKYGYSDLEGLRAETTGLIALCGMDCADLQQALDQAEAGRVSNGKVIYPDAIGSLKALRKTYGDAKAGAAKSIMQQVGKYILVRKTLFAENAALDGQSAARLEVEVINTVDYPGQNVQAEVESGVPFDESDMVYGAGNVRGVTYADGKLRLYVRNINASGSELFVFEKNRTLLRTTKATRSAVGMEDYSARVSETREVSCEADVDGFYVNDSWESLGIDGVPVPVSSGFARARLSEGEHVFQAGYTTDNAYSRRVSGNSSIKAGERIYERYQVELMPIMDMEYLQTFASVPQSQYVKEKKVITVSGEKVWSAETAEGFAVTVSGLRQGKAAKFEVSYYVDNSSEYARREIEELDALNLSNQTRAIVDDARNALVKNDTAGATEKIQKAYEQIEKEKVETAKLQAEYSGYYALVSGELEKIEGVLAGGGNNGLTERLSARRDFLKDLLDSLDGEGVAGQVSLLKTYDKKWLPEQLRLFKKNASAEMNRMYSEYLNLEVDDAGLAGDFAALRSAYNRFDASGSLEDAYALAGDICGIGGALGIFEQKSADRNAALVAAAGELKTELDGLLKEYGGEYSEAKGSRFESIFKIKTDEIQGAIKQMDSDLKKGNASAIAKTYDRLVGLEGNVTAALGYLEGAAYRNSRQAKEGGVAVSGRLSEKDAKKLATLSGALDGYLASREWVKTLKASDEISKIVSSAEGGADYGIIIWLSAIFVAGVVAVYYFRGRKGAKPQKTLRKLDKAA